MQTADYDSYLEIPTPEATGADLAKLSQMADLQFQYEREVARLQVELKAAQDRLVNISETLLPELMESVGMAEFRTANGLHIRVERNTRAQISKDRRTDAFAWLEAHEHAALIKRKITATLGRGEGEKAEALGEMLRKAGFDFDDERSVHPQTLQAWVREMLAQGKDFPLELFGVYDQRIAKVKST